MSALTAYLAKNYLNASSTDPRQSQSSSSDRPKKRRKKDKDTTSALGLIIADDDATDIPDTRRNRASLDDGEEDGDSPQIYESYRGKGSAEFRRKKVSAFRAVPGAAEGANGGGGGDEEGEEAERIIREAGEQERERRRGVEGEEGPQVVEESDAGGGGAVRMESGVKAGLQTAADTKRLVEREERERRAEEKRLRKEGRKGKGGGGGEEEETIYRDATGRRIDVTLKRAEARQAEVEAEKARKREREEAMGDVQRRMREERKVEEDEARFLTVARGVDDEEMNERLKEVVRWDDPMAGYMAQKEVGEGGGGGGKEKREARDVAVGKGSSKTQKKVYQGAAPPNRYSIAPGWRWDGVDRGNGFEKDWFQARSRWKRNEEMSYQWQMDE